MSKKIIRLFFLVTISVSIASPASAVEPGEPLNWMLRAKVGDKVYEGAPLKWSGSEVHLLGRDGRLLSFKAAAATEYAKTAAFFRAYSPAEMRGDLIQQFGAGFDVSGTGHYLVVHPKGQRDYWAARFEELYRSFVHYFSVRGFQVEPPKFPLVAIVVPKQQDLYNYARREGVPLSPGVLGYYSEISNRVILFDRGGGSADQSNWAENNDTIIHEATHQTAFNTGVHRRMSKTPSWVGEGLATMFEARGVWNGREHRQLEDRLNKGRLADFKRRVLPGMTAEYLVRFVSKDAQFRTNPANAYATAWALSFFLSEKYPRQYAQYMSKIAKLAPFEEYDSRQRLADFTAEFGDNMPLLCARFVRFMEATP